MLGHCAIIAFVSTTDALRSRQFYEGALGLRCVGDEPFALVLECQGTMLRVSKVEELVPAPFTVLGWRVADLHSAVTELSVKGVVFERFPGMKQDDSGIWSSPGGALVAWFKDPDGNLLSLTQFG